MKITIQNYCIRGGLCEDLCHQLLHLNAEDDQIDLKYEGDIRAESEMPAKDARATARPRDRKEHRTITRRQSCPSPGFSHTYRSKGVLGAT